MVDGIATAAETTSSTTMDAADTDGITAPSTIPTSGTSLPTSNTLTTTSTSTLCTPKSKQSRDNKLMEEAIRLIKTAVHDQGTTQEL